MLADQELVLELHEVRAVTQFATGSAARALSIFEEGRPGDTRPRAAVAEARAFADGADRTKALRVAAWAAQRAASDARVAGLMAATEAARAAVAAAGAAFLHPLPRASQVRHILSAAAHAARAFELSPLGVGTAEEQISELLERVTPTVQEVLRRYPPAPSGGGRIGELIRRMDAELR